MTIKKFKGQLVDPDEKELANYGVIISIINDNPLIPEKIVGKTSTDSNGKFNLLYSEDNIVDDFDNNVEIKLNITYLNDEIFETNFNGIFKDEIIDFGFYKNQRP